MLEHGKVTYKDVLFSIISITIISVFLVSWMTMRVI